MQVVQQVLRRPAIQTVLPDERLLGLLPIQLDQLARQLADRSTEFQWSPWPVAAPKRHLTRLAWRRSDQHAVVGDLQHAP